MGARVDVKQAARIAAQYVADLFAEEGIQHIGLEEVDDREDVWNVTIGFFRDLDKRADLSAVIGSSLGNDGPSWRRRTFKIVSIDNGTGKILSLTHRSLPVDA